MQAQGRGGFEADVRRDLFNIVTGGFQERLGAPDTSA
jgi:hypothetical protein